MNKELLQNFIRFTLRKTDLESGFHEMNPLAIATMYKFNRNIFGEQIISKKSAANRLLQFPDLTVADSVL